LGANNFQTTVGNHPSTAIRIRLNSITTTGDPDILTIQIDTCCRWHWAILV